MAGVKFSLKEPSPKEDTRVYPYIGVFPNYCELYVLFTGPREGFVLASGGLGHYTHKIGCFEKYWNEENFNVMEG
jgi:hypothetical protein